METRDNQIPIEDAQTTPVQSTAAQPTFANLAGFARSDEVEIALMRAARLATTYKALNQKITTSCLLFGLAEGGGENNSTFKTSQFLRKQLTANGKQAYERALVEEFPFLEVFWDGGELNIDLITSRSNKVTFNVVRTFRAAEEISRLTFPHTPRKIDGQSGSRYVSQPQIGAHHLLAALLVLSTVDEPVGAQWALSKLVTDETDLRRQLYDFVVNNLSPENHGTWRRILINLKLPEIESTTAEPELTDSIPQPTVAGFMADEWNGRDLLGITRDVNALASLVAAYKIEPPLSIGLFGDWGSGKSHFMRQMKKRVETLSRHARESGLPQRDLGYYKNIVQIEFNAWHYIEGNLWASLVDHIFANLKLSERESPNYAEDRRNKLIEKLGLQEELKRKIDSQVEEREQELRKVEERKQHAQAELTNATTQLTDFKNDAKASLESLTVAIKLDENEKELLNRLGIDARETINGAEVRKNYDELKGRWNRIKAQWLLFRSDKRVGRRYLLSGLTVLFVVGGPLVLKFGTLPRVPTVLVTALGLVTTLIAAAKPAWEEFQKTLKALEKRDQEVERERLKRITELESKVNALGSEVIAAKLKSDTVGKEIEQLRADIAATSSSRILAEFIEDRAAASDYRRHLGLLALIRRDFEKLRNLFEQQRKEEEAGTELTDDKIKINRIVLYIDDLDRCPPERVVQVLQAIHLLLAFPLFVVVVGVDSRWITRSLQQNYEWLREADELIGNNGGKQRENGITATGGATPHDYLEKIFQIPFWLRSMNEDACVEFLDGLTKDTTLGIQTVSAPEPPSTNVENIDPVSNEANDEVVSNSPLSVETATESAEEGELKPDIKPDLKADIEPDPKIDLAPRSLTFTDKEIEYMKKLVPLIGRSPRAVKRFLNCYRLIRVGLTPEEFERFVGEQGENHGYKAAMILLGIITGAPTVSSYVIDELKKIPVDTPPRAREQLLAALEKNAELQQQPDAQRLNNFLKTHDFGKPPGALFLELLNFVPQCSRFSFKASRANALRR